LKSGSHVIIVETLARAFIFIFSSSRRYYAEEFL
jgi:hypothetical protein